jgi:phosphopantetheinyl transferase (holo-ACP synthase)
VKEALFKALGCGLTLGNLWHDVDLSGLGSINLTGKIKELACKQSIRNIFYSHATSKNYVVAVVILEQ